MTSIPTLYFADTGLPVPYVLSEQEVIRFLRLDTVGTDHPEYALQHYRQGGLLRGTQISKRVFYTLPELISFLERQTEAVSR